MICSSLTTPAIHTSNYASDAILCQFTRRELGPGAPARVVNLLLGDWYNIDDVTSSFLKRAYDQLANCLVILLQSVVVENFSMKRFCNRTSVATQRSAHLFITALDGEPVTASADELLVANYDFKLWLRCLPTLSKLESLERFLTYLHKFIQKRSMEQAPAGKLFRFKVRVLSRKSFL